MVSRNRVKEGVEKKKETKKTDRRGAWGVRVLLSPDTKPERKEKKDQRTTQNIDTVQKFKKKKRRNDK